MKLNRCWIYLLIVFWSNISMAQDTLVLWTGKQKPVFIKRMDERHVIYSRKSDSTWEFSIPKDHVMHIQAADSTKDWELEIYGKDAYGTLPLTTKGIDSLAHKHVAQFYHGDHVVGSHTFMATVLATPLFGIPYAIRQASKPVEGDGLGMMGNPHQNNPAYLASYKAHAKRQNQNRILGNAFLGTILILMPVGIAITAVQGMSIGVGN